MHETLFRQFKKLRDTPTLVSGEKKCKAHILCLYIRLLLTSFGSHLTGKVAMGEFKHFVIAKFKEGVNVEELTKGMEKLVSEIDAVKSFEWGVDTESLDVLRQGFTHAFLMTFNKKEDFTAFQSHPNHVEFSATFSEAIEKFVLLDFPSTPVKAPA
ncbi:hypothetical protein RIF29_27547 [Crotalaria pallida]|uniref:Stress-response A/B barrel domain-containing protein n=1 Tax=Crotalaria pallida TaxID=3830 RepID=A0AAN9EP95_CROPI